MPNKKLALEWYSFAKKNLETAILLNKENHYTDVIAIEIQQSVEKALKSVFAFNGDKIPRTHSLEILFNYAERWINLEDINKRDILIISDYFLSERYPGPKYFIPDRNEINVSIQFAQDILNRIQQYIAQD